MIRPTMNAETENMIVGFMWGISFPNMAQQAITNSNTATPQELKKALKIRRKTRFL